MSVHSYSRCWLHLIWGTLNREKLLNKEAAARLSRYLTENADTKGVYMKINYVNADHVHALVDLPTQFVDRGIDSTAERETLRHWVNANNILEGKFAWGRGYGAFSVSECQRLHRLLLTLQGQEEHHRVRTFADELQEFIERHGSALAG